MTFSTNLARGAAALLAGTVLAGAASADVTPQQVWDNWKSLAESTGETFSAGSEEMSGDTLTLGEVRVVIDMPEGRAEGVVDRIVLAGQDDGTVRITMSDRSEMTFDMTPADADPFQMVLATEAPGFEAIASGSPETMDYTYSAPELAVAVEDFRRDGKPVPMQARLALSDLAGSYTLVGTGRPTFDSELAASGAVLSLDATSDDPKDGGRLVARLDYSALTARSHGTLAPISALAGPAAERPDMDIAGSYGHGDARTQIDFTGNDGSTLSVETSSASGTLEFEVTPERMRYEGSNSRVAAALSGSRIPLPEVTAALDESRFRLAGPIARTEAPEDVSLVVKLSGLTLGDPVWQMLDPAGMIPRDPAELELDLSGKARLLSEPGLPAAGTEAPPAELDSLQLNALRLSVAGAELTGTGGFTFDNSDMTTFPGIPAPDGSVMLRLAGSDALLNTLVQMGLVPQQQAMVARMMLGSFARPAGEDVLETEISVTPDGAVAANGQRLR